ncbi:MAG: triose-phosphate isomerase [Bacteroidia bacterium]|nr:triose-phosphate isomerase [Bacteroidia bacterium]
MRRKIVAGNWKMNKTQPEFKLLVEQLLKLSNDAIRTDIIIAPPYLYLEQLVDLVSKTSGVYACAQNCSTEKAGAFTGEVSAEMIASVGVEYVIIGHSERRSFFGEDNEVLAKKVNMAVGENLKLIFCCGEQLKDREAKDQEATVRDQLKESLFHLSADAMKNVVIAYEPVWAIGTGLTATPDQAQEMHAFIRGLLMKHYDDSTAESTPILYGGSCNEKNAAELFSKSDIDGGLIGGASLDAEKFVAIARSFA